MATRKRSGPKAAERLRCSDPMSSVRRCPVFLPRRLIRSRKYQGQIRTFPYRSGAPRVLRQSSAACSNRGCIAAARACKQQRICKRRAVTTAGFRRRLQTTGFRQSGSAVRIRADARRRGRFAVRSEKPARFPDAPRLPARELRNKKPTSAKPGVGHSPRVSISQLLRIEVQVKMLPLLSLERAGAARLQQDISWLPARSAICTRPRSSGRIPVSSAVCRAINNRISRRMRHD
jgi:hypothetical protein